MFLKLLAYKQLFVLYLFQTTTKVIHFTDKHTKSFGQILIVMPSYTNTHYKVKHRSTFQTAPQANGSEQRPRKAPRTSGPDWELILERLAHGLQKMSVALRYRFHQITGGQLEGLSLPWFKIALAAVAFFILTRKNIQFSVNMQAPAASISDDRESRAEATQMGLSSPVALHSAPAAALPKLPSADAVGAYIERFGKVAQSEQEKYGIPASIKMGWAILCSSAGSSPDASQNNSHFGESMGSQTFASAWENWRAHSLWLTRNYPQLFQQDTNYKGWARAIERSGAAPAGFGQQLLGVIDHYQLYQLD